MDTTEAQILLSKFENVRRRREMLYADLEAGIPLPDLDGRYQRANDLYSEIHQEIVTAMSTRNES